MSKYKRRVSAPTILGVDGLNDKPKPHTLLRRKTQADMILPIPEAIPEPGPKSMPKYYLKGIDREAAEKLLDVQPIGTFLLRDRQSSNVPGSYTLSMRDKNNQCRHFKIDTNSRNHKLAIHGYQDNQFDSLENLIAFFVRKQKSEVAMKPYGQGEEHYPTELYEDMSEDITHYQTMDKAATDFITTLPPVPARPSYENINDLSAPMKPNYENIGNGRMRRRPPPPEPPETTNQSYENMIPEPRASTLPLKPKPADQPGVYQNLPPKDEALPLPPRRPRPIYGTSNTRRKGSLPANLDSFLSREASQPPPPLPVRPHASTNYQNLPGKGSTTVDSSENPQRRIPLHRSYTEPPADTKY